MRYCKTPKLNQRPGISTKSARSKLSAQGESPIAWAIGCRNVAALDSSTAWLSALPRREPATRLLLFGHTTLKQYGRLPLRRVIRLLFRPALTLVSPSVIGLRVRLVPTLMSFQSLKPDWFSNFRNDSYIVFRRIRSSQNLLSTRSLGFLGSTAIDWGLPALE